MGLEEVRGGVAAKLAAALEGADVVGHYKHGNERA
jgi:hypothetical protein